MSLLGPVIWGFSVIILHPALSCSVSWEADLDRFHPVLWIPAVAAGTHSRREEGGSPFLYPQVTSPVGSA